MNIIKINQSMETDHVIVNQGLNLKNVVYQQRELNKIVKIKNNYDLYFNNLFYSFNQ